MRLTSSVTTAEVATTSELGAGGLRIVVVLAACPLVPSFLGRMAGYRAGQTGLLPDFRVLTHLAGISHHG